LSLTKPILMKMVNLWTTK